MNNILNVNDIYFIIDSTQLTKVSSGFYGYALADSGIICSDSVKADEIKETDLKGEGTYTFVHNNGEKIIILQDFIGSQGIYLYRDGDYYALSNSFILLLDHVRRDHPITLNKEYADYYLASSLCPFAFSETLIHEIELLDRSVRVIIDIKTGSIDFQRYNYEENTLAIDSEEGIKTLDAWYNKWSGIIYGLLSEDKTVSVDLSGGFDSRTVFSLFMRTGIDLNRVIVNSIQDELHTHKEDYEIATQIANHYSFELNREARPRKQYNYSLQDVLNVSLLSKLGSHKQMYWKTVCYDTDSYVFSGTGGETIRGGHWADTEEQMTAAEKKYGERYPAPVSGDLSRSIEMIVKNAYARTREKFAVAGREVPPEDVSLFMYRETRCRSHFGKDMYENYYGSKIKFAPLLDPALQRMLIRSEKCEDHDLLIAVILDRFGKGLLDFKFDSGRKIDEKTVAYAKEINRKFPYTELPFREKGMLPETHVGRHYESDNPLLYTSQMSDEMLALMHKKEIKYPFMFLYGEDAYDFAVSLSESRAFHPEELAYPVIIIAKIASIVFSKSGSEKDLISMLSEDISLPEEDDFSLEKHPYLKNYITLRADIKNSGSPANGVEIIDISDKKAKISYPSWLTNDKGRGLTLNSLRGSLTMRIRAMGDGDISFALRTKDVRDKDNKRIPFWVDCIKFSINDMQYISSSCAPVSHDAPFRVQKTVKDGEELVVEMKWAPHDESSFMIEDQEVSRLKEKLDEVRRQKAELENLLQQTYKEKSEINAKLKQAYADKTERGKRIKELENESLFATIKRKMKK